MSKSTPISDLPDANSDLVQQVLDEVELSKQQSERDYGSQSTQANIPYMQPIQTEQNIMQQMPMNNMQQQFPMNNMMNNMTQNPMNNQQLPLLSNFGITENKTNDNDEILFGFTYTHLKNTIVVLVLFLLLHLPITTSLLSKVLSFVIDYETGQITILGVLFKGILCTLIFLIITRFI